MTRPIRKGEVTKPGWGGRLEEAVPQRGEETLNALLDRLRHGERDQRSPKGRTGRLLRAAVTHRPLTMLALQRWHAPGFPYATCNDARPL